MKVLPARPGKGAVGAKVDVSVMLTDSCKSTYWKPARKLTRYQQPQQSVHTKFGPMPQSRLGLLTLTLPVLMPGKAANSENCVPALILKNGRATTGNESDVTVCW